MAPATQARKSRGIVFRADAGQRIGTGHVMRCLTLAAPLIADGVPVHFICKAHAGHMAAQIRASGASCTLLPLGEEGGKTGSGKGYQAWLGGPLEDDARASAAVIAAQGGANLLVVDHYALDAEYHQLLRAHVGAIAVLDELGPSQPGRRYACDLLIDPNVGHSAQTYASRVPQGCRVLVGPRYAPLRPAFARLRAGALARRAGLTRPRVLLISLGGADPDDVTSAALRAPLDFEQVHVALSGGARHLDPVRAQVQGRENVHLHVDTNRMPELMAQADVSVGAAGVTAIERCVLGLPTLMVVVADNQLETAAHMARAGAVVPLGTTAEVTPDRIGSALSACADNAGAALRRMSRAAADLCDGQGLSRIIPVLFDMIPLSRS